LNDQVNLLMEEIGCARGEAELALELASYDLKKAIRILSGSPKDIVVLKGKFKSETNSLFGLFLSIFNLKSGDLLRLRAVVSHNPSVYVTDLDAEWGEFEKQLYACRLRDGSLQNLTQQVEHWFSRRIQSEGLPLLEESAWSQMLDGAFENDRFQFSLKKQEWTLVQRPAAKLSASAPVRPAEQDLQRRLEPVLLQITLEADSEGCKAKELKPGDVVHAQVIDQRDIAQYLAWLLGGKTGEGLVSFTAPLESVLQEQDRVLIRARLSMHILGEAGLHPDARVRCGRPQDRPAPWWKRWWMGLSG